MDKIKHRYFVRYIEEDKEYRLPFSKQRTVVRAFFQLLFGNFQYMEIVNEAYLDKRVFKKKRDKLGNLVRGYGETKRQEWFGKEHEQRMNQFREGLFDPETKIGYEGSGITIKPLEEEQLDDCFYVLKQINEDKFFDG